MFQTLKNYFGYDSFRPLQQDIIQNILAQKDTLVLMPTGGGKSICYQLPALLMEGTAIVVSPLISLMKDQVESLQANGIAARALNSSNNETENINLRRECLQGKIKLLYISPERLLIETNFLLKDIQISLFAIDEAHCISQWGHEFRPYYLDLADMKKEMGNPLCLALTATATKKVQRDILDHLKMEDAKIHIHSVNRPNISIFVETFDDYEQKLDRTMKLVKQLKGPGIIYTNTRNAAEKLVLVLQNEGMNDVSYYHGGMDSDERLLVQKQFLESQLHVIVCTNAFGMGINKPDIRYVIHYHTPSTIEGYVQEIGRAGRDSEPSAAVLLHHPADLEIPYHFVEQELPDNTQVDYVLSDHEPLKENSFAEKIELAGLSETGQRFMEYHLKKAELLNRQDVSIEEKTAIKTMLITKIEERKAEKIKSLKLIERWATSSECKRKELLRYFGEAEADDVENCCSSCDAEISHFYGKQRLPGTSFEFWEDELKRLLRQEVYS